MRDESIIAAAAAARCAKRARVRASASSSCCRPTKILARSASRRSPDARNRLNAKARVAALLVALADVIAPPRRLDLIPVELHRKDLAALLALRHESVSRALAALERSQFLTRTSEGVVLRREEIAKLA